jgi:ATP-dependent Clp protease ATP-binding subunit ClpC
LFERFTDHARDVLRLEGLEAHRMHHEHLGTEHLLLALVREPDGHGHQALENLGVTLKQLRGALKELLEDDPHTDTPEAYHLTPRAKHVMAMAVEEAREHKNADLGTEHLLLALLREPEGVAMQVLAKLNLTGQAVHDEVERILQEERRE